LTRAACRGNMGPGGDAVTEAEWDDCADPQQMLWLLRRKASYRKMRLFFVACCRKILSLLVLLR